MNRAIASLRSQMAEIRQISERRRAELQTVNEQVSLWSTAQQLDHILKVAISILERILLRPEPLPGGINLTGRLALFAGRIPRGRGKSPERLRGVQVSSEELATPLAKLAELVDSVDREYTFRPRAAILKHPFFGTLTDEQSLQFAVLHTRHHLKIIHDILRDSGR